MKSFVKAMDRTGSALFYLAHNFPQLGAGKIKKGFCWPSDPQALQRRYV